MLFFSAHLKKQYRIGPTRTIFNLPIEKFDELATYIQKRIDGTMLARTKRGSKNYSTFQEYVETQNYLTLEHHKFKKTGILPA